MCGIFGGIKNVKSDTLKILGICNEDRGTDSTGLFDSDGWIKDALSFRYFLLADKTYMINTFQNYLVGHTRFGTTGAKTSKNAHPFTFGNITGVHNGVISNFEALKKEYKVPELECDSEIIFYLLDKKGTDGLKELDGYFAIVWKDERKQDKLFFFNHNGILAYTREKDSLYFCSDSSDLLIALGIDTKFSTFEQDTLYTIDIYTLKIKKLKIKGLRKYTPFKYAVSTPTTSDNPFWINADWDEYEKDNKVDIYNKNKANWKSIKKFPKDVTITVDEIKRLSIDWNKDYNNYTMLCPYCNEQLTLDEVESKQCIYCRTDLSGEVFSCYHCESLVMSEQIDVDIKCPICNMHMILDEKYLVTQAY